MRQFALWAVLGFLTALSSAFAADAPPAARLLRVEVPAPSLEGNLLGTPAVQPALVYLPPSYQREPERSYPVLVLLHGIFDTPETWLKFVDLPAILDRAVAAGTVGEMIVVMPAGGNVLGGGFYRDSPVTGGWGSFVRGDLVSFVDGRFRTQARRERRAIAGHSMGGYGAIWQAMTGAEVFGVAYAISPALLGIEDDVSQANRGAWTGMLAMRGRAGLDAALEHGELWAAAAWGVCLAFIPDPGNEVYLCDPPYRQQGGELLPVEAALDRWRSGLPLYAARDHVAALRSMVAIGLEYGLDDQFAHIPETTQELSAVLADLRVPYDLFVHGGDHRERLGARLETLILPWISRALGAGEVSPSSGS